MSTHLLIRHGEAKHNLTPTKIGGRSNHVPLTLHGEWQSALFGERQRNRKVMPDAVLHSGAVRAQQTAEIAMSWAGLSLPLSCDPRLQEMSMGKWEGVERKTVFTPEMVAYLDRAGLDGDVPTAETLRCVQDRMWDALVTSHTKNPDGTILVFTHGLSTSALIGKLQGWGRQEIRSLKPDHLSVTRIDMPTADAAKVVYVGEPCIR